MGHQRPSVGRAGVRAARRRHARPHLDLRALGRPDAGAGGAQRHEPCGARPHRAQRGSVRTPRHIHRPAIRRSRHREDAGRARGGGRRRRTARGGAWPAFAIGRYSGGEPAGAVPAVFLRGAHPAAKPGRPEARFRQREHSHRHRRTAAHEVRLRRALAAACRGSHPAGHGSSRRHLGTQEDRRDGRGALCRRPAAQLLRPLRHHRVAALGRLHAQFPHPGRRHSSVVPRRDGGRFPGAERGLFPAAAGPGPRRRHGRAVAESEPWQEDARPWRHRQGNNPSRQDVDWS